MAQYMMSTQDFRIKRVMPPEVKDLLFGYKRYGHCITQSVGSTQDKLCHNRATVRMALLRYCIVLVVLQFAIAAPQVPTARSIIRSNSQIISSRDTSLTTEEQDKLFSLHEELVNIPSISEDEVECAEFLSEYLSDLGYYVEEVPVGDTGTFNVFAYPQALKDEGTWPEVLITSHIDTVSLIFGYSTAYG